MAQPIFPAQYILGRPGAGVTTGTGNWVAIACGASLLTITTTGAGTITAGTLLIEETDALDDGSAATPAQLSTLDLTTITAGKKNVAHATAGAYGFIRARLSAAVTGGGTVVVSLMGL
ncbi:MAG TPA: hypothetical protein VKE96_12380 [Vicinamibacterales bacterium]|nr:hypothetical protein [Vicinamibacterales bacterium]